MVGFLLHGVFFSNGAILVYDITDEDSFQKVWDDLIGRWTRGLRGGSFVFVGAEVGERAEKNAWK